MLRRKSCSSPILTSMCLISLTLAAGPAAAQAPTEPTQAAVPSVEGYLCKFAGKCDGTVAPIATRDAPATRGFRLARPATERAEPRPSVPSVRPRPARAVRAAQEASPNYGRQTLVRPAVSPYSAPSYSAPSYSAPSAPVAVGGRPRADLLIGFRLNSAELTPEGRSAAQVFARSLLLPELRAKRFVIEGHTDLRGSRALNSALSARRAQAVADYLVAQGVAPNRLEARGFGPSVPLPGHRVTDPANRRVEAELVP